MEAFLKVIGHEFCDITLMLDGTPIHAHKVVLQRYTFSQLLRTATPRHSLGFHLLVCVVFPGCAGGAVQLL